ncbi:hypothetical protein [Streptomyces venezuelae]|nr:hypothetical protein [Streptomyces venezuelae]
MQIGRIEELLARRAAVAAHYQRSWPTRTC